MQNFLQSFRFSVRDLARDTALTPWIALLTVSLLLLYVLIGSVIVLQREEMALSSQSTVRLAIADGASRQGVGEFFAILTRQSFAEDTAYITKQQAMERARIRDPELVQFLEENNLGNPFVETIAVTITSAIAYEALSAFLKEPQWSTVLDETTIPSITAQQEALWSALLQTQRNVLASLLLCLVAITMIALSVVLLVLRRMEFHNYGRFEELLGAPAMYLWPRISTTICVQLLVAVLLSFGMLLLLPTLFASGFVPLQTALSQILLLMQGSSILIVSIALIAIAVSAMGSTSLGMYISRKYSL